MYGMTTIEDQLGLKDDQALGVEDKLKVEDRL
jgi:hypothetical protein